MRIRRLAPAQAGMCRTGGRMPDDPAGVRNSQKCIHLRHKGGSNLFFVDGHVEWRSRADSMKKHIVRICDVL